MTTFGLGAPKRSKITLFSEVFITEVFYFRYP